MQSKLLVLLWVFFSALTLNAQVETDTFPSFRRIASSALFEIGSQAKSSASKPFSLFIFVSPECPLCQNYSSVLRRLKEQYGAEVDFYGIVPGAAYNSGEIKNFEQKFKTGLRMFVDKKFQFTNYLQATVTPQAILLDADGGLIYSGAIDDWVAATRKKRLQPSQHYLKDALAQALLPGEVKIKRTKAIGCKINDY